MFCRYTRDGRGLPLFWAAFRFFAAPSCWILWCGRPLVSLRTRDTTRRRPRSQIEVANDTPEVVQCNELHKEVQLTQSINKKEYARKYHFDRVYDADTSQERLYETAVAPMVDEVLQGFNCTVFAYGQTGTGKTHTMTGDMQNQNEAGVIPRAVGHIFRYLNGLGGVNEFTVKCSFLELYNEEITDLLAAGDADSPKQPKVRIMEDPRAGVVMQGLEEPHVKTAADIFGLLETGNAKRRTAETLLNKQSSRSHSVFIVTVSVREVLAEGEEVIRVGKLYLVDLAGSENITRSGAVDQRAKEAGNINKSLLTLGRVITALVEGQGHVPYRDSKLTRLLRDSLGGRTKTCIIATIAPTVQCQEETMSTLDYAHRAKNIKNKPEVNQKISKTTHLKEMGGEIARLKAELVAAREKNGVYMPHAQYEEDQTRMKEQAERIEGMEAQMEQLEAELGMTRAELEAAQQDIAEGQYIIEEQRQCEQALAEHAASLTKGLSAALTDVTQLFARVDAKNVLETSNIELMRELAKRVGRQVKSMDATLQAAVGAQLGLLGDARGRLDELSVMHKNALEDTKVAVGGAKCKVDGMVEALQGAFCALADSGASSLEGVAGAVADFRAMADEAAKVASETLAEVMRELQNHGAAEESALKELRLKQEEHGNSLRLAVASFVGELEIGMTQVTNEVITMRSTLEHALASHKADVTGFKAHYQASIHDGKDDLVRNLTNLVAKFAADQQAVVDGFCDDRIEKMEADGASIIKNMRAVNEASETAAIVLKTHQTSLAALQDAADRDTVAAYDAVKERGESIMATAGIMHDGASSFAKESRDALKKFSKDVATTVGKNLKMLDAARGGHCDKAAEAGQIVHVDMDQIDSIAHETAAAQGELVQRIFESAEAGENDLSSFAEDHKSSLNELKFVVDKANDNFAVDDGRDNVPLQRPVPPFPVEETVRALCAPSIETLSRRFRGGIDDMERSEGNAGEHIDVLDEKHHGEATVETLVQEQELPQENMAPNLEDSTPDDSDITMITSRKRIRSAKTVPDSDSPPKRERSTKLKAAFEAGESRRATRRTSSRRLV
jgi:kinesin family protein 11